MSHALRLAFVGLVVSALMPISANATPLREAKTLRCTTAAGTSTAWDAESPRTKPNESVHTYVIQAIDLKMRTATVVGRVGTARVSANWTNGALSFLEQASNGAVFLTTVYDSKVAGARRFPAVDSRHNPLFGDPVSSQLYGWCEIAK
jgi:hypothetical protein